VQGPKLFSESGQSIGVARDLPTSVEFLKDSRKFAAVGARIPKGVLLVRPPGTGKKLLARAVTGEAGVPVFSISGSDFDFYSGRQHRDSSLTRGAAIGRSSSSTTGLDQPD